MNTSAQDVAPAPLNPQTPHILVVDDETSIFDVFALMFPAPGHVVAVAENGARALQLAAEARFDVAFVDCFLGIESGPEVAEKLHAVQPKLHVVLMSGYLQEERAAAMEKADARAFLMKPFSFETAQTLVRRLFGTKKPVAKAKAASEAV